VTAGCELRPDGGAITRAPRDYSDRLNFRLPPFFRMAWATGPARDRWSAPLNRLVQEVRTSEWLSVVRGLRMAAIIVVPRAQAAALTREWTDRGLRSGVLDQQHAMRVRMFNGKVANLAQGDEVHLVTRQERVDELEAIWGSADPVAMATWLGYPPCCAAFLRTAAAERQSLDTTWAMVEAHADGENGVRIAEMDCCEVNPLLSTLGLRATPHRPCSFFCQETRRLATAYGELRTSAGAQADHDTLPAVLSWPMEWSSLHGIIEVTLPVLKLCYDGDATATTYKVRLTGGALPEEAAQGLAFPHRLPERRAAPAEVG
jgi:hypothetical protein